MFFVLGDGGLVLDQARDSHIPMCLVWWRMRRGGLNGRKRMQLYMGTSRFIEVYIGRMEAWSSICCVCLVVLLSFYYSLRFPILEVFILDTRFKQIVVFAIEEARGTSKK